MEYDRASNETNQFGSEDVNFAEVPEVIIVADEEEPTEASQATTEVAQPAEAPAEIAQPTAGTVRIESVSKVDEGESSTVLNSPRESYVSAAARRGETQEVTITRDGESQPVKFEVSPSLVPPRATTSEVQKPEAGEAAGQEGAPKFVAWARIVADQRPVTEEQGREPKNPETSSLDVEALLADLKGPFQIKIVADGVPEDAHQQIMGDVGDMVHDAQQSSTGAHHTAKLEDFQKRLGEAMDSALVRRTVVVGVQDPADLDRVAHTVANSGFSHDGQVSWRAETDARGRVVEYHTEAEARTAGENDPDAFISAAQFAEEIQYPENSVPGYGVRPHETYGTNREIPKDAEAISVAKIIDNNGNLAGDLRVTEKDLKRHGIIAASSGAGKTYLIRSLVTGAVKASYERSLNDESAPDSNRAVVIVDFEKIGNYSEKLADQLAGAGITGDHATVHRISPGAEGVRANINLLRLNGTSPSEQISVAVKALSSNIKETDGAPVFEKYASMAMERAFEKLGWNIGTSKPKYPHGTPPIPDMEQVSVALEEVMKTTDFAKDIKGNIGTFTETTLRQALRGVPGQLFHGGYDIDWNKVIDSKGVTVIELGRISDINARRVAMTGIFRGLTDALKAANSGDGDTDATKLLLVMDETGGIFNGNTESGRDNAREFTHIRGRGMAAVIAQQGDLAALDSNVITNTGNIWSMQMNSKEDRAFVADRMGIETPKYLANVAEGRGLYHGRNMEEGPVRFTTESPDSIPKAPGSVVDAGGLIDKGTDPQFFSGEVKALAKDELKTGELGAMIQGWVELNTALVLTGRETAKIAGDLKTQLQGMNGLDAAVRDSAITTAVSNAIDSRPELMKVMDPKGLKEYLVEEALAQVTGKTPPEKEPLDYVLKEGHYSAVKDMLIEATTAPRLEDSARYEKSFFGENSTRKVGGATAEEQLDNLKNLERASLKNIGQALENITINRAELTIMSGDTAEEQLANLADPDHAAKHVAVAQQSMDYMNEVRNEIGKIVGTNPATESLGELSAKISQAVGRPLLPNEHETLALMAEILDNQVPDRALGYSDMRRALDAKIQEAKLAPALDLTEMEERYGERFDGQGEGPAQLAQQQLAAVEAKERKLLAQSSEKITMSNILFAPDLLRGGQTLDNVVGTFVAGRQEQGAIYDEFRRTTAGGRQEGHTLVEMLSRSDPMAPRWGEELGKRLLLGRQLQMPVASSRFLVRWFAGHITKLTNMANDRKARQQKDKA